MKSSNSSTPASHFRFLGSIALALGLFASASPVASAATLYWDADGSGASGNPPISGVGGTGTWDNSTTANWWNGSGYQLWNGAGGQDIADFRGTAGAVSVSGTVNANQLIFGVDGYTVDSGTINLTGVRTINVGTGFGTSISSVISGSAGLTKTGDGTLTLSGDNTFTGTATFTGALILASNTALGATGTNNGIFMNASNAVLGFQGGIAVGNEPLVMQGTVRNISGNNSFAGAMTFQLHTTIESQAGTLTLSGTIADSSRTLAFGGAGNIVVDGVISRTTFNKNGTGRLTLNANNTGITGIINITAGAARLTHQNAIGTSGTVNISNGAALELEDVGGDGMVITKSFQNVGGTGIDNTGVIRNISGNNTLTASSMVWDGANRINSDAGSLTIQASVTVLSGLRSVTLGGAGQTNLTGNWTLTNGFTKDGSGLAVLSGNNEWGGTTLVNGGVLRLASTNATSGGIGVTGGTRNINVNGGVVELGFNNFERGLGTSVTQVQFTGDGGFSAFGADRVVNLGGASAAVTWGSGSFVPNGNRLLLNSSHSNAQVDFQNSIALGGQVREIFVADNTASTTDRALISGVISSTTAGNGLLKSGAGQLILGAVNTYTGSTQVNAGTLLVGTPLLNGSTAAGSAVSVAAGAVIGGHGTIHGNLTLDQGAFLVFDTAYTLTLGGTLSLDSSFGVASLRNLNGQEIDWSGVTNGTYTLMNTGFTFSASNITNFGSANALSLGGGRSAYFQNGSLQLVVIPEPSTFGLLAICAFAALLRARRRRA